MASQPSDPKSASSQPAPKTPVTLHSTAHIADGAYLKGTHPITIGADTLIHPRAYILSIHAPLSIDSNTLIHPKAIIGAPLPTLTSTTSTTSPPPPPATNTASPPTPTIIGSHVVIHPHATIHHSTTISSHAIIESHSTLLPNSSVGPHSKICSGITISSAIPSWTVVYGNGEMRRLRKPLSSTSGNANATSNEGDAMSLAPEAKLAGVSTPVIDLEIPEKQRLVSLSKEREAATTILRNNAKYLNVAKQKAQQREGDRSEKVR